MGKYFYNQAGRAYFTSMLGLIYVDFKEFLLCTCMKNTSNSHRLVQKPYILVCVHSCMYYQFIQFYFPISNVRFI